MPKTKKQSATKRRQLHCQRVGSARDTAILQEAASTSSKSNRQIIDDTVVKRTNEYTSSTNCNGDSNLSKEPTKECQATVKNKKRLSLATQLHVVKKKMAIATCTPSSTEGMHTCISSKDNLTKPSYCSNDGQPSSDSNDGQPSSVLYDGQPSSVSYDNRYRQPHTVTCTNENKLEKQSFTTSNSSNSHVKLNQTKTYTLQSITTNQNDVTFGINAGNFITGTTHQNDIKFRKNAGKQCVTNCLMALITSKQKHLHNWNVKDVDTVLKNGDALYSQLSNIRSVQHPTGLLFVDDLPTVLDFQNSYYTIQIHNDGLPLSGILQEWLKDQNSIYNFTLQQALERVFQNFFACFVTFANNTMIVMKHKHCYYLFDPHSRNNTGIQHPDGKAILLEYTSLDQVLQTLYNLASSLFENFYDKQSGDIFNVDAVTVEITTFNQQCPDVPMRPQVNDIPYTKVSCENANSQSSKSNKNETVPLVDKVQDVEFISQTTQMWSFKPINTTHQIAFCENFKIKHFNKTYSESTYPECIAISKPEKVFRTKPDGDCFFHAISYAISNSQDYHNLFRKAVTDYMLKNEFYMFLRNKVGRSTYTIDCHKQHVNKMKKATTWATDKEIWATSCLLKVPIYTFSTVTQEWCCFSSNNSTENGIYLNHTNNNHYDVVQSIYCNETEHQNTNDLMKTDKSEAKKNWFFTADSLIANELKHQYKLNQEYTKQPCISNMNTFSKKSKSKHYKDKNALRMKQNRSNKLYKLEETIKNKNQMKLTRCNSLYKAKEKQKNITRIEKLRSNSQFQKQESESNIKRIKLVRMNTIYKENEVKSNINRMKKMRLDENYREQEAQSNVNRMKKTRLDQNYSEQEAQSNVKRMKKTRLNQNYSEQEAQSNVKRMKKTRLDPNYREQEVQSNVNRMRKTRLNAHYRKQEVQSNINRMKKSRSNSNYKKLENKSNNIRLKQLRTKTHYNKTEEDQNLKRAKHRRLNPNVKLKENNQNKTAMAKRRRQISNISANFLIETFEELIESGPTFICTCCEQLWYKHSVISTNTLRLLNNKSIQICFPDTQCDNPEYVCHTCKNYLKQDKIPPCAIANGNDFPKKTDNLNLQSLEWRLVSPRLMFLKLHKASRGNQYKIEGNVCNIPVDVENTVNTLPRSQSDDGTIKLQLKRKLQYNSCAWSQNVRPSKVIQAAKYLTQNGPLYKKCGIKLDCHYENSNETDTSDDFVLQDCDYNEDNIPLDTTQIPDTDGNMANEFYVVLDKVIQYDPTSNIDKLVDLYRKKQITIENNSFIYNDIVDTEDDWSEVQVEREAPGVRDTMLSATDFLEDSERDKVYHVAPGEGNTPISIFKDTYSEELAYPEIFLGHSRTENKERRVNVKYSEVCKSELRRKDRRAAKCIDNIFFKTKKLQMKTLLGRVQLAIRKHKTKGKKLTAKQVKNSTNMKDIIHHNEGYAFLRSIRGSPPYFEKAKKDLLAMIRQLGHAPLYATFSAAETRWTELLKLLSKLVDNKIITDEEAENMNWDEKCRLIQTDPVTCSRHFDHRVQCLFNKFFSSENSPIGKLQDYFVRIEFQHRGSPHVHCLLWTEAPIYGVDPDDEVISYIDSIITCRRPTEDESLLNKLVQRQIHRHSRTCKKSTKNCRFNFPQPPMQKTQILQPLEKSDDEYEFANKKWKTIKSELNDMKDGEDITFHNLLLRLKCSEDDYIKAIRSSIVRNTIFLKRTPNEIRINNYNKQCLLAWKANMDIQYVLDVYACAMYIVGYISKGQRGMSELLAKAVEEVKDGNMDIRQQVRHIGNKFLNSVEISAQEAVYLSMQLPLRRSSRQVVFINTSPPDERIRLLKSFEQLEEMDDNSEDIECSNMIDRYSKRSKELDSICLAEYAAWYDVPTKIFKDKTSVKLDSDTFPLETSLTDNEDDDLVDESTKCTEKKRTKARIIRSVWFNKDFDKEKHFREMLMLFYPWRDEDKLLQMCSTYEERYNLVKEFIDQQLAIYAPHRSVVDQAMQDIKDDKFAEATDSVAPNSEHQNLQDIAIPSEITNQDMKSSYDIGNDIGIGICTNENEQIANKEMCEKEFRQLMQSMNSEQQKFIYHILHHETTSTEPIFAFLSGGAGVGKSYVTKALYQVLLKHLNSLPGEDFDAIHVALLAPTGKAAYNIKGNTIHGSLAVPVSQSLRYKPLDADRLNTLRCKFSKLKYIFIDEISMVGNGMLNFIHKRLQDIKGNSQIFGGVNIIAIGDLFQLKPVCDGWIFKFLSANYGPLASNLWQSYFNMYELTTIMRQRDSLQFAETLNRLREGLQTEQDITYFKERCFNENDATIPSDAQRLFLTNKLVNNFNTKVFLSNPNVKHQVKAVDSVVGNKPDEVKDRIIRSLPIDPTKTMQLHTSLDISIDDRMDICLNVNVDDGQTNGASNIIKNIQTDSNNVVKIVWVLFDDDDVGKNTRKQYSHLYTKDISLEWTPIFPITRMFKFGKGTQADIIRKQFPLRPSAAKTVHRSQGDTVDNIVVDFTGRQTPHIHYVGLSRVRSPTETRFDPGDLDASYSIPNYTMQRLDNNRNSHGLVIYCKGTSENTRTFKTNFCEMLIVNPESAPSISIVSLYRYPNTPVAPFIELLDEIISTHQNGTFVFLGDFNIDMFDENKSRQLKRLMCERYNFEQLVNEPTTYNGSCIDCIFSNSSVQSCGVLENYYSDHKTLYLSIPKLQ